MINLYLHIPEELYSDRVVDEVCSYLQGNRGFQESDIVVTDPDGNNVFCINLGDDYTPRLDISAEIVGVEHIPGYVNFYLGEENNSGIKTRSKNDLLNRISRRIDELVDEVCNVFNITLEAEND